MNKRVQAIRWMAFWSMAFFMGCSKTAYFDPLSSSSYFSTDERVAPFYGDTVLRVTGNDYLFKPVVIPGQGHFVSWPAGLVIDPKTGVIDASLSEPGARYNVGFVRSNGDTAYSQVVLAGASYTNTVYVKGAADSLLQPYCMGTPGVDFVNGSGAIDLNALQPGTREVAVSFRVNGGGVQTTKVLVRFEASPADAQTGAAVNRAETAASSLANAPTVTETAVTPRVEALGLIAPVATKSVTVTTLKPTAPAPCTPRPPQIVIINKGH